MFRNQRKTFLGERLLWQSGQPSASGAPATPPTAPPAQPPAPITPPPSPDADPVRQFKQSELDHMFAERGRQGATKAVADMLKDLGLENVDGLKAIIAKAKEQENASKTETQKLADEIVAMKKMVETAKSDKDAALAQATERLMKAAVITEAAKTFDETELNSVWMALKADAELAKKIVAKGDDFDGIADVLKEVAKAHPRWLKQGSSSAVGTPRSGGKPSASGQPNPGGPSDDANELERVARHYRNTF